MFTPEGVSPTLTGADGGGGRNPAGLLFAAGVVSKGNGESFLMEQTHAALTGGGGMPGQGYPCVLTAGFCAGAAPSAGGIGYQPECAPTLKGSESGTNMVPSVLCLNDQGGRRMDVSENKTGTLRARMDDHPPLIAVPGETICIAGNIIDREAHNGGNGFGYQPDICYTLNTADRHVVFSQQRSDEYVENTVSGTQAARQYKDATDLVCDAQVPQSAKLIRRLTALECERLQGFPDGWTDIPGASDSKRYRALGNSVAIPCVDFVLRGIVVALTIS